MHTTMEEKQTWSWNCLNFRSLDFLSLGFDNSNFNPVFLHLFRVFHFLKLLVDLFMIMIVIVKDFVVFEAWM